MKAFLALEWRRLKNRCIYSWQGLIEVWAAEASFRFWTCMNALSALAAFLMPLSALERALILSLGVMILAVELVNSAIERAVDYISEDHHDLAQAAKDAGSAGVAIAAVAAGIAWLCILIGKLV